MSVMSTISDGVLPVDFSDTLTVSSSSSTSSFNASALPRSTRTISTNTTDTSVESPSATSSKSSTSWVVDLLRRQTQTNNSNNNKITTHYRGSGILPPPPPPPPLHTVVVQPNPIPYAQLCFLRDRSALITLFVGKNHHEIVQNHGSDNNNGTTTNSIKTTRNHQSYHPLSRQYEKINMEFVDRRALADVMAAPSLLSSSSSDDDDDSRTGWSTGSSSSSSSSTSSWTSSLHETASVHDNVTTTTPATILAVSPQDILWLDGSWLYEESSVYSYINHTLLLHEDCNSEHQQRNTTATTCGKLLRNVHGRILKHQPHRTRSSFLHIQHRGGGGAGGIDYYCTAKSRKHINVGKNYGYTSLSA